MKTEPEQDTEKVDEKWTPVLNRADYRALGLRRSRRQGSTRRQAIALIEEHPPADSIFRIAFDAWCRGCNDDINEGDPVGFIPGEKGVHCIYCVIEALLYQEDDSND